MDYPVAPSASSDSQEQTVSIRWSVGDVIGCYCDILRGESSVDSTIRFSYSLNGRSLGVAFDSDSNISLKALLRAVSNGDVGLSPAITLEQGESMILNIGQRPFKYYSLENCSESGILKRSIHQIFQSTSHEPNQSNSDDDIILLKELQLSEERKQYNSILKELQSEIEKTKVSSMSVGGTEEQKAFDPINIESTEYKSAKDLEIFGLDHLKHELTRRGLKSGGTLTQRAERLYSVRGIPFSKIDKRLKVKK